MSRLRLFPLSCAHYITFVLPDTDVFTAVSQFSGLKIISPSYTSPSLSFATSSTYLRVLVYFSYSSISAVRCVSSSICCCKPFNLILISLLLLSQLHAPDRYYRQHHQNYHRYQKHAQTAFPFLPAKNNLSFNHFSCLAMLFCSVYIKSILASFKRLVNRFFKILALRLAPLKIFEKPFFPIRKVYFTGRISHPATWEITFFIQRPNRAPAFTRKGLAVLFTTSIPTAAPNTQNHRNVPLFSRYNREKKLPATTHQ